jgi:hypothetical protein
VRALSTQSGVGAIKAELGRLIIALFVALFICDLTNKLENALDDPAYLTDYSSHFS